MPGFDTSTIGSVLYAQNVDFTGNSLTSGTPQVLANGQLLIGAATAPYIRVNTLTAGTGVTITNGPGSITIGLAGGGAALETLSDDVGTSITPSANNIQLVGHVVEQGATKFSTVVAGTHIANINPMSIARWIVDPLGFNGTHTTIAAAITSASSGDTIYIMDGTYTENPTLKNQVNLVSLSYGQNNVVASNVTIIGKITSAVGGNLIQGINLQTNNDFCVVSTVGTVYLLNCGISATNNTPFSITTNAAANITLRDCSGDLETTGIALVSMSNGSLNLYNTYFSNVGISTTSTTCSAGSINLFDSIINMPLTTSSTGIVTAYRSTINNATGNAICLTTAGSGISTIENCTLLSGTASAISVGTGTTVNAYGDTINSSNTNAITGLGTLNEADLVFTGSSSLINTSTITLAPVSEIYAKNGITFDNSNILTNYATGTWTPTLVGASVAGTTTYTTQQGYYTRIGNMVTIWGYLNISAATGTGDALFGGFPFTIKNQSNFFPVGSYLQEGGNFPVGTTMLTMQGKVNTLTANVAGTATAGVATNLSLANTVNSFMFFQMAYQV
jgi:hypothetical protein